MDILQAIIQGIVQGLTEFLPVSSSGHLSLSQHVMGVNLDGSIFFNVMLHLGTLVAVCAVYYKLIIRLIVAFFRMIGDIFTGKFHWKGMDEDRRMVVMLILGLLPLLLFFIPIPGTGNNIKARIAITIRNSIKVKLLSRIFITIIMAVNLMKLTALHNLPPLLPSCE